MTTCDILQPNCSKMENFKEKLTADFNVIYESIDFFTKSKYY